MADWREQYDRMQRWSRRLWLSVEHLVGGSDQGLVDAFYAFAQTCYHLVDWLENDHSQHIRRARADEFVDSRLLLAYCRDICNGSKHAQLQAKRVEVTMRKTINSFSVEDESGHSHEQVVEQPELFVPWGDQFIDAESFAKQCTEEWDRFLRVEGLLPPE